MTEAVATTPVAARVADELTAPLRAVLLLRVRARFRGLVAAAVEAPAPAPPPAPAPALAVGVEITRECAVARAARSLYVRMLPPPPRRLHPFANVAIVVCGRRRDRSCGCRVCSRQFLVYQVYPHIKNTNGLFSLIVMNARAAMYRICARAPRVYVLNGPYELYVRSPALSRRPATRQACAETRIWLLDAQRRAGYLDLFCDVSRPQQNI